MDMAVLVDAQGDMLDNIEVQVIEQLSWMMILSWISFKSRLWSNNWIKSDLVWKITLLTVRLFTVFICQVSSAVDHVQQGNTALQKAKKLQKNSRKWMCIAIIILLIIVAIIVVAVIKPWSSNKGA